MMIFLATVLFLFICGFAVFLAERAFGGQDFKTSRETINRVIDLLKQRHLESGNFYDLGSGGGELALKIGKAFPQLQITGIDDSSFRILLSNVRSVFKKNVNFKKANIFKTNTATADIIYLYLPNDVLPELEKKLQKELKPGALVITNKVSFPKWQSIEKVNELFIYKN